MGKRHPRDCCNGKGIESMVPTPSFDLGLDLSDIPPTNISVDCILPESRMSVAVTKRARMSKKVAIENCSVSCNISCSSTVNVLSVNKCVGAPCNAEVCCEVVVLCDVQVPCDAEAVNINDVVEVESNESLDVVMYGFRSNSDCFGDKELDVPASDVGVPVSGAGILQIEAALVSGRDADVSIQDKEYTVHANRSDDREGQLIVYETPEQVPISRFDEFNEDLFNAEMNAVDKNGTSKSNTWCKNRFNDWRHDIGLGLTIPFEHIPLQDLSKMLLKFFFVLKKRNGEHYPSQSVMQIYKGLNRILCQVQRERIDATGIQEPEFIMHRHPFFGRVNKAVILAMKKSIKAGANKGRRKVDYFTAEDEVRLLAHPHHQADTPEGVQKRFGLFCTNIFFIRGNSELYKLHLMDFTLDYDEQGRKCLRYDETVSKNHNPTLSKYQPEHFRDHVFLYNADILHTFEVLISHMPADSGMGHLFLSPKKFRDVAAATLEPVWFRKNSNLGEVNVRNFLRDMASTVGLVGDYTSKSGRVTGITRMVANGVPLEVIASNTGHKNLKSIERYNRVSCLKNRAAQAINRPNNQGRSFNEELNSEMSEWRLAETGSHQFRSNVVLEEISDICANVNTINEAAFVSVMDRGIKASSIPARLITDGQRHDSPSHETNASKILPTQTPAVLVEEEMRFLAEYFNEFVDGNIQDDIPAPRHVPEALPGIRFAMQRSLALLRRENSRLREELRTSRQSHPIHNQHEVNNLLKCEVPTLEGVGSIARRPDMDQNLVGFNQLDDHVFKVPNQVQIPSCFPSGDYPVQSDLYNQPTMWRQSAYNMQMPVNSAMHTTQPTQIPSHFLQSEVPIQTQPMFTVSQPQPAYLQPFQSFGYSNLPVANFMLQSDINLQRPYMSMHDSSLNTFGNQFENQIGQQDGKHVKCTPVSQQVAPVFGNTVYNYQTFDLTRLPGGNSQFF